MQLKPNNHWRWYFDDKYQRIMLDLDNGTVFRSSFPPAVLIPDAFQRQGFTVEDAASYALFMEKSHALNLSPEQKAELVLNAITALRFLKPQMPKSWHFSTQQTAWQPSTGAIACVWPRHSLQMAHLLVAGPGENASLCLVAQPTLPLPDRDMGLGEAIKIMNNRLFPFTQWRQKSFDLAI